MPAFSRGASAGRVSRWLTAASIKLRNLADEPVERTMQIGNVRHTLTSSAKELEQVYESCIDARNAYASHPRIRKQLIAVAPLVNMAIGRIDAIVDSIKQNPESAPQYARAIGEVAIDVASFSFVPSAYVPPTADVEDRL